MHPPFNRPRGVKKINRVVIPWLTMTRAFPYPVPLRNSFALRVESRFVRATHSSGDDPLYLITLERNGGKKQREKKGNVVSLSVPLFLANSFSNRGGESLPSKNGSADFPRRKLSNERIFALPRNPPPGQAAFKLLASARGAGSVKSA